MSTSSFAYPFRSAMRPVEKAGALESPSVQDTLRALNRATKGNAIWAFKQDRPNSILFKEGKFTATVQDVYAAPYVEALRQVAASSGCSADGITSNPPFAVLKKESPCLKQVDVCISPDCASKPAFLKALSEHNKAFNLRKTVDPEAFLWAHLVAKPDLDARQR